MYAFFSGLFQRWRERRAARFTQPRDMLTNPRWKRRRLPQRQLHRHEVQMDWPRDDRPDRAAPTLH